MKKHIKRGIALVLVLVMAAGFLCEIPAFTTPAEAASPDTKNSIYENMLADYNPSFESLPPVEGWNVDSDSNVAFAAGKGVDGTTALFINDTSDSEGYSTHSDDLPVTPGIAYNATVKVSGTGKAQMYLRFYDAAGTQMADTYNRLVETTVAAADGWKTLTISGAIAPAEAATMRLWVATPQVGSGTVYFDEVTATESLLGNADFEIGTTDSWTPYTGEDCTITVEADKGKGAYSVKIEDNGAQNATLRSNKVSVVPGQRVVLSVDMMPVSGTPKLYIYYYNAAGERLTENSFINCTGTANEWKTFTMGHTAPANAASVELVVATSGSDTCTVYVDNASIALVTIENTDFETGSLDPWTKVGVGLDRDYIIEENAGRGNYSAMLIDGKNNVAASLKSNYVPVVPGQTVKVSVDTKVLDDGNADDNGVLYLYAYFYDADGKQVEFKRVSCPTDVGEWKTTSLEHTVPAGAVTMAMAVNTHKTSVANVCMDTVSLTVAADGEQTSFAVVNPGFELEPGITNWTAGVASVYQNAEYASDGQYSVCINDFSDTLTITFQSELVSAKAGNMYSATVQAMGENTTTQLYLRFYNSEKERVGQKYVSVNANMDAWTPLKVLDVKAPEGTAYVGVTLATNKTTVGRAYFDDVMLYDSTETYKPQYTLVNPDFESGSLEPWFIYATQNNTATISADKATKDNKYSLLVQDTNQGAVQVTSNAINVTVGETYGFAMDSYMAGTSVVKVTFRFYNSKEEIISQETKSCSGAKDMWKKLVMHQVAPEGAVFAKITLSTGSSVTDAKAYLDNMVFAKQGDKNFPDLADDQSSHNPPSRVDDDLLNPDFECGTTEHWNLRVTEGALCEISTDRAVSGNKYSVKILDQAPSQIVQMTSQHLKVTGGQQYGFAMSTWTQDTLTLRMYVRFYDVNGSQIAEFVKYGSYDTGAWKKMVMLLVAPEEAKTCRIVLSTGSSSSGYNVYVDNLIFAKEGDKDFPSMTEDETGEISIPTPMTRPDWGTLQSTSHPRLYFNSDELNNIKKFAQNSSFTSYGFSGKSAYESLVKVADEYVKEDTLSVGARNEKITLNGRKLMDPINIPEFQRPPAGFEGNFPYLENYSKVLYGRLQTLAMAYAMTGDVKYANRAIQYMSDMAEWTYWTDFIAIMGQKHWDEDPKYRSSMDTAYLTIGVATAYDMCYDAMTNAQREKISAAMISKGLEQMYLDLDYTDLNNKLQHRASAMIMGSIAIANNSNIPELEKYLIRGYRMTEWYFDAILTYGNQEGYSYTNNVIDFHMEAVKALGRFTNDSSLLTHRLINEVVVDWVVYFMRPGDGYLPGISDANSKYYFVKTMCVLSSELENPLAGYYLTHTSAAEELGAMARLIYCNKEPVSVEDEEEVMIAANTLVEEFGYGSLRTGFDKDDTLLVMIANQSEMYHNQYDQMSFVLGSNSQWLLDDPGYPTNMGNSEIPSAMYGLRYGHNTYVVDEQCQVNKGNGTMDLLLDTDLIGELYASAPGAYEKGLLTRAERNAIQINHGDASYYVMIDDFASNGEHVYGWNLNTGGWKKLTVDGTQLDVGTTVKGHEIALAGDENDTFVQFVSKDPVEVKPYLYNDEYGPMLRVNSDKAKEAQFMTVINTMNNTAINGGGAVIELVDTIDLFNCTAVWSNDVVLELDVKEVAIDSKNCVFYRGQNNGDWIEFPFNVEQAGEYYVSANMGKHGVYGIYNIYLDGELVYEGYDGYSSTTYLYKVDLGHRLMEVGEHKIRLELVGKNPATNTATIGIHGVILEKERVVNMNENTLNVLETYDDENILGGKFSYLEGFTDVVLYNRGNGELKADLITANAKQATLLGVDAEKNYEGFSVVDGTSMVIGDKTMFASDTPISAAVDLREGYIMSTFGDKEANVKLNVDGYCYNVMVDGEVVPSTKDGEMICFTVSAGNHNITFEGACVIESYTYNNDATCRMDGTQTGICTICGNPTTITKPNTKTPHAYDQKVVEDIYMKSEATCTEAATYFLSCACGRCNRKGTFTVGEPLGHKWNDKNVCEVCGEHMPGENNILLWVIIGVAVLAVAAGGVTIFLVAKKKKKQTQEAAPAEAATSDEEVVLQGEE